MPSDMRSVSDLKMSKYCILLCRIAIHRRRRGSQSLSKKWKMTEWCYRRWNRFEKYFSCSVRSLFTST